MQDFTAQDRRSLCETFDRFLGEADISLVRRHDTKRGHTEQRGFWKDLAEMGLTGLVIPEEFGGMGAGPLEIEALCETAGAHLLSSPFLVTSVLAASLVSSSSDAELKQTYLPPVVSGESIIAAALTGSGGGWTFDDVDVTAKVHSGASATLSGRARFVFDTDIADILLVLAKREDGIGVFLLPMDQAGLRISPLSTNDPGLSLSDVWFDEAEAVELIGVQENEIHQALNLARVAQAGEHVGGASRTFEMTVEYARGRFQFGRAIGSFQAIKHMIADLYVELESSTSAARSAAQALADQAADTEQLVSLAAFACADAYRDITADAIQIHGGIAYTTEHPCHLYWRRARSGLWLFGASDFYRNNYLKTWEAVQ